MLSTINYQTVNLMPTKEQNSNKIKEILHKLLKLMTSLTNRHNRKHTKKT